VSAGEASVNEHGPAAGPPVGVGLIGAGAMGAFHGESLARRIFGAWLAAVADPVPGVAANLAARLGCAHATTDTAALLADPAVEAVVIAAPARFHADLVVAAASAGKAVFCEKPMAITLDDADRAIAATRAAGAPLQVGFQRRFDRGYRAARERIDSGEIGEPQLLRSLTRDPDLEVEPARIPPWTMFFETLIHDFDALRWLNPAAEAVDVYAVADALVRPDWKDRGLLDTAMTLIRFDNGAMANAEASFRAVYGYDVRAEVFGSGGMVTVGEARATSATSYGAAGLASATVRSNLELFHDAYVAELADFVARVRSGETPLSTGEDARAALRIALAAIRSVETNAPVRLDAIEASQTP
jgi:myo-inositol 2-dehydrogenase/D-chiro-inositol 1-dehydrogenase